MPSFAANLSLMFTEWDFLDRFQAAADHGFLAVEFQFAHEHSPEAIAKRLEDAHQTLALFNAPAGRLRRRRARTGGAARTVSTISAPRSRRPRFSPSTPTPRPCM